MREARKKGILFDVGHGGGSFFWNMTIPAIEQKFYPDSIFSTDMHFGSMNGAMKDLLNVMSKFLNVGVPIDQLIQMTTMESRESHQATATWESGCRLRSRCGGSPN